MEGCIFCEIASGKRSADMVAETGEVVIFKDLNPKARIHYLIVPRKHVASVKDAQNADCGLLGGMILAARDAARRENLAGYKLIFNVGRDGGQVIDHIHLHLLGD